MECNFDDDEITVEVVWDVTELDVTEEPEIVVEIGDGGASWGSITGILANQTDLAGALAGKSDAGHDHDGRYYTEQEIDEALAIINTALNRKSNIGHTHDDRYYTETEVDTALAGKSDVGHTHDDRYYTESEVDTALAGKSDTGHTHDDRYYTESEVDTALAEKSDTGHTHDDRYYTESEIDTALAGKSDTGHDHDDRYYTETEIDAALQVINTAVAGKSDTGHTHDTLIDRNNTSYKLGLRWVGVPSSFDYVCVWDDTDGYTKVVRGISNADFKKKVSSSLPTIIRKSVSIPGPISIGTQAWLDISSYIPAAPSGYTLLFVTFVDWTASTNWWTVSGDGKYLRGAAGTSLGRLDLRYYYILTENYKTN